jgi:hypothetical protein
MPFSSKCWKPANADKNKMFGNSALGQNASGGNNRYSIDHYDLIPGATILVAHLHEMGIPEK